MPMSAAGTSPTGVNTENRPPTSAGTGNGKFLLLASSRKSPFSGSVINTKWSFFQELCFVFLGEEEILWNGFRSASWFSNDQKGFVKVKYFQAFRQSNRGQYYREQSVWRSARLTVSKRISKCNGTKRRSPIPRSTIVSYFPFACSENCSISETSDSLESTWSA